MHRTLAACLVIVTAAAAAQAGGDAPEARYGAALTGAPVVSIVEVVAHPDAYLGKTIQVEGRITDVCPMKGCWIDIAGGADAPTIRYKVQDDVVVFPLDVKGKSVRAEGTLTKREMTREQAIAYERHLAEEKGQPFDPATITGPKTLYQLDGAGAVVH